MFKRVDKDSFYPLFYSLPRYFQWQTYTPFICKIQQFMYPYDGDQLEESYIMLTERPDNLEIDLNHGGASLDHFQELNPNHMKQDFMSTTELGYGGLNTLKNFGMNESHSSYFSYSISYA